jgi:hypothetical protein
MRAALGLALALTLASGCGRSSRSTPDAGVRLQPLAAESWLVVLPGARAAVPLGATSPRPVVIALPGQGDRPEWQCGTWSGISGSHPFVLCPASTAEPAMRGALKALKRRFDGYVAAGPAVLVALGASVAPALRLVRQEPEFFSRVVLIEGDQASLQSTDAYGFVRRGGRKMLFVCARPDCEGFAERNALFVRSARGDARALRAPADARGLDAHLAAALQREWSWLTEGDSRYPRSP